MYARGLLPVVEANDAPDLFQREPKTLGLANKLQPGGIVAAVYPVAGRGAARFQQEAFSLVKPDGLGG